MTDIFNLAELTKEMIAARLQGVENAPAMAAEITRQSIVIALKGIQSSGQAPGDTVREICFGAMCGLMLTEKDMPQGAVCILQSLAEVAQESNLDPGDLMTWAMEAMVKLSRLISAETHFKIRQALEDAFTGTGDIYDRIYDQMKGQGPQLH